MTAAISITDVELVVKLKPHIVMGCYCCCFYMDDCSDRIDSCKYGFEYYYNCIEL